MQVCQARRTSAPGSVREAFEKPLDVGTRQNSYNLPRGDRVDRLPGIGRAQPKVHKTWGASSSYVEHEHQKVWVRPGQLQRFVMRLGSDGQWRWQLRRRPGTQEDFDVRSAGRPVSKWRFIRKTRRTAVMILEFDLRPERCGSVGVSPMYSPIHFSLWQTSREHCFCDDKLPIGKNRALTEAEATEERILLSMDKAKDSCVYLSLFHLAVRRTTKDWLKDMPEWGRAGEQRIDELIQGWVAREGRALFLSEVRLKGEKSTAGTTEVVKQYIPAGSDGSNRDTLVVHKTSPHGASPVLGHCVPICGPDETAEFSWHRNLGFIGPLPEWTAVVVPKLSAQIETPKLKPKEKERVTPVDQMTLDALDEILCKSGGKEKATSSHVVSDAAMAKVLSGEPKAQVCVAKPAAAAKVEAAACEDAKPTEPLQTQPEKKTVDCAVSTIQTADSGDDPFVPQDVGVRRFRGSEYDRSYMLRPFIFEGPTNPPPFPHVWRAGFWGVAPSTLEFSCDDWIERWVIPPSLCTATIKMVREWGTRCLYSEPKQGNGIRFVRAGVMTDGCHSDEYFQEGSLIKMRGVIYEAVAERWRVCGEVHKYLRLQRISSGSLRSCFGVWRFTGNATLLSFDPRVRSLAEKELQSCKWQAEAKTQKDIIATGFVNIVRADQVSKKQPLDPDRIVPALRVLAKSFEKPRDVAGPFTWGACYSGCGAERPGKFKGRLCPECSQKNTTLGSWSAAGFDICNSLNFVRYPGVINLRKKHPQLKDGAKTWATYGEQVGVYDKSGQLVPLDDVMRFSLRSAPGARLGGIGLDGYRPFSTAVGPRPLLEAILYRVFKDLGDRRVDKNAFATANGLVDQLLPGMLKRTVDLGVDEFTRMLNWAQGMKNARRRRALLKELFQYRESGYEVPRDWDKIKPFVKTEHLPELSVVHDWVRGDEAVGGVDYRALEDTADDIPGLTSEQEENEDPDDDSSDSDSDDSAPGPSSGVKYVARLIQAPSDYSHLVAGPILKPMIGMVKDDWDADNWIFYASVDPHKLDHWLDRVKNARSWFWSDYSAFDATYSPEAWDLLEGIYARVCPDAPRSFWDVLEKWRKPKGDVPLRSTGPLGWRLRYQAGTCNCSGRDDTALANALLNGIVLSLSFAAALAGVDITMVTAEHIERAKDLVNIAIVGDDSLVACEFNVELYRSQVEANIKRFGLIAKVCSSDHLYDVTFLGQMPYPVGKNEYQWGPTLGRRLYKAFWQLEADGGLPAWTRGVAQQLSLFRNVPILLHMAEQVDWLLAGHSVTKQVIDPNRVWAARTSATKKYSSDVFDWLASRYEPVGVTATMIREDIRKIRSVVRLPAIIRLDSVSRMLAQDDL